MSRSVPASAATDHDFVAEPSRDAFTRVYDAGAPQVVWTRLVADLETPVSAFLKLSDGRPMSTLLESVEGGAIRGRYSFIGLKPDLIWRANGDAAEINRTALTNPTAFTRERETALKSLRALLAESRIALPAGLPPNAAGVIGYMGYDTARLIENLPDVPPDHLGVPDAILMRPTLTIVFDTIKDEMIVVTPVFPSPATAASDAYAAALDRLQSVIDALDEPTPHIAAASASVMQLPATASNTSPAEYLGMVARAKEYIAAGDIFQVVLAQRFSAPFTLPPFALYRALRRTNQSPFLYHLDFGNFAIERYSHVMHISSTVVGTLDPKHDAIDALFAGLPAGTLSGAPKVRAMQIIDELEKSKRGPYGGCVGYFSADGQMDTCIVLRTAIVKDGQIHVQAGAGVVSDSDAAAEQQECVYKSAALFRAAEEAVRFAAKARKGNR